MILEQQNIEGQIIELANSIYQNLGIKRWIEEVSVFKEVQAYFQICQIIFPDYSIDFYRIDNDPSLKKSQKMQKIIDLISNLVKSDISHISGVEIVKGNYVHLINFFELLEALTINMIQNEEGSVQSAKEYRHSSQQANSYHTVIGINKEFEKIKYRSDQNEQNEQNATQQIKTKKQIKKSRPELQYEQQDSIQSSTDFPIKPIQESNIPKASNKKIAKQQDKQIPIKTSKKQRKDNHFDSKQSKIYQQENCQFLNLVKKIYQSQQELKKNYDLTSKKLYFQQLRQLQRQYHHTQMKIQKQATFRKKTFQNKLIAHNHMIASLNGQQYIKKAVKNLKRQQRQMKKQAKSKDLERQLKSIEDIMDFNELDSLLQEAVYSNFSKTKKK